MHDSCSVIVQESDDEVGGRDSTEGFHRPPAGRVVRAGDKPQRYMAILRLSAVAATGIGGWCRGSLFTLTSILSQSREKKTLPPLVSDLRIGVRGRVFSYQ